MKTLNVTWRDDGVAVIRFDQPGSPVNVLSRLFLEDLQEAMREIGRNPALKACVLASSKPGCFVAGADLDEIASVTQASEAQTLSQRGHEILDRIESGGIPFVAAIDGVALGGGLELILACHARVAADSPKTIFALPEVQLGLLPGAGGTQRLPRLIGLPRSLGLLLTGNRVRAKKALQLGLIDALAPSSDLIDTAARLALSLTPAAGRARPRNALPLMDRALTSWPLRLLALHQARAQVLRSTRGNYPAPLKILDVVSTGLSQGASRGKTRESELFGELVVSPEAKNLVWIFHAGQELKRAASKDKPPTPSIRQVAVLGAGLMGEGIASISLPLAKVVLRDISDASLDRARKNIQRQLDQRVKSGSLLREERDRQWNALSSTVEMSGVQNSDFVIEAVFEDLELKRKVLAEVEERVAPDAVFASNTSALPISKIAAHARHPERVLGMHYFSPVPKMPLLEIIAASSTSAAAIDSARAFGVAQGKTVIVVKDGPGFYTTRILAPLLAESMQLLSEGVSIDSVDRAIKDFGFPVGPVALLDEVGIDVGAHVSSDLGAAFGDRWGTASDVLDRMVKAGYLGKKNKRGFYDYSEKSKKKRRGNSGRPANPDIHRFFGASSPAQVSAGEITDRIVMRMVNEAIHCLQENIISCARDGDIGAIMGLGFPPFRGGPFHFLDSYGLDSAVKRMRDLSSRHGRRFEPARLLVQKSEKKERFHEVRLPH